MIYLIDPSDVSKGGCKKLVCESLVKPPCGPQIVPLYGIEPVPI